MTTIPSTAVRIARADTSDFATPIVSLRDRARIAVERPDLADDMRVGRLSIYGDVPPEGFDPDEHGPWIGRGWIEMREHTDPLNPDSVVVREVEVAGDRIATEIVRMRAQGAIPGYLAAAVLLDIAAS